MSDSDSEKDEVKSASPSPVEEELLGNGDKSIKEMDKDEIRLSKLIKKRKWKQIKIKKPVNLHSLFPGRFKWRMINDFYTIWYVLFILIGLIIICCCALVHYFVIKLWIKLLSGEKPDFFSDSDLEVGNIILFCATIIPLTNKLTFEFRNIPYASLPENNNYFFKPGKLLSFMDCYNAFWVNIDDSLKQFKNGRLKLYTKSNTSFSHCPQKDFQRNYINFKSCLTMNMKISKKQTQFKSVILYLTGQSMQHNHPNIAGDGLVHEADAIFISINYRLGIFGFPRFSLIKSPRNLAYVDFVTALRFINNNMDRFKGNLSSITLLAEESGGTLALAYLFSRKSKLLFSRLWLIDPSTFIPPPLPRSLFYEFYSSKDILCNKFNTDDLIFNCLQNYTIDQLLNATPKNWLNIDNYFYHLPSLLEQRLSLLELQSEERLLNPLKVVMSAGSNINDIPLVIYSNINYMPKYQSKQFVKVIGHLLKQQLYARIRLDLLSYQTSSSQVVFRKEVLKSYSNYIKFVENRSIYSENLNDDSIPLGFEMVLKAIISDIRSLCPLSSMAKYLQINAHIVHNNIYRIIDSGRQYAPYPSIDNTDEECDLNYFLQDIKKNAGEKFVCKSKIKDLPHNYYSNLRKSFLEYVKTGRISKIIPMQYPLNSSMKDLEETYGYIGRLGFRTPGVRDISALQLSMLWRLGNDEYSMLKTSSKVN